MRVPDVNLHRRALEGIRANMSAIERASREIASGKRVLAPSDDPGVIRSIVRANSTLREAEQFARNLQRARTLVALEDDALQQLDLILVRGRELALAHGGSGSNETARNAAAQEVRGLISGLKGLGNTRLGERYIFGGERPTTPPFTSSEPPPPLPEGGTPVEIAPGETLTPNQPAARIFGDTGALAALQELLTALEAGDPPGIQSASGSVDVAHDQVQIALGETGARMNRLDQVELRTDSLRAGVLAYRADLEEAELDEAISRLAARQAAYEAALLVTSRILGQSLADYLR